MSLPDNPEAAESWPFQRDNPDVVVLPARAGRAPSAEPPVRIFLGTEEAQYRAERIFFWSIEKVRDPSRVYEIHLMKNVAGFDRKGWRTGFTKYRFAIPEFAGRSGRAIYNDVDQIYLADPALLFDLEMGEHGYLAISAEETSVMLIDCARMASIWNRDTANREGKHALIRKPAATPGLWGVCDPHWNARDNEYVEGLTKCLHYTALHQQPWQPFPGDYSYHPNPLAYIWHGLEREADAAGYEIFSATSPSPDFARRVHANRGSEAAAAPLGAAERRLISEIGGSALWISAGPAGAEGAARLDLAQPAESWPEGPFATVIVSRALERVPPADIPWVLGEAFARARQLVLVRVPALAAEGPGSATWWQLRLEEAAARHPGVSWHLEVLQGAGVPTGSTTRRRSADVGMPRVWALLDGQADHAAQVLSLAEALGWPFEAKRLVLGSRSPLPNAMRGASLDAVDRMASSPLEPPWPDLLITCGADTVPVVRWLRAQAGDRLRLVQLGRPDAPFELFDLIITYPQERLPIRPNVLHVAAPLLAPDRTGVLPADVGDLARPWTALMVPGSVYPYVFGAAEATALGKAAADQARRRGGSLLVGLGGAVQGPAGDALRRSLGTGWHELDAQTMRELDLRRSVLAAVDATIVTAGDPQLLAEACLAGKPVALFDLPKWYDAWVVVRPLLRLLNLAAGGGKSYRGTPLQQHALSRLLDSLIARGLIRRPTELGLLHEGLVARGLVTILGGRGDVATPKPLDDLRVAVERVRRLMTEATGAI